MNVRLSLRVPKASPKKRHDWKAFTTSPDLQARYTVEVRNRFQLLDTEEEYTTGFSMKPNTTRFHIKAPFCHTVKASELYIGPQLMDFVMVMILKKMEENKMMMGVVVRLLMMR